MPVEVRRHLCEVGSFFLLGVLGIELLSGLHGKHFDLLSHPCPALESSVCTLFGYIVTVNEFCSLSSSFFVAVVFHCGISL